MSDCNIVPTIRPRGLTKAQLVSYLTDHFVTVTATGCWELPIARHDSSGYPQIYHNHRQLAGHRLFYTVLVGEIQDGMCCLHKCDNRACVNPDHLFLGTHADNMADKTAKGRARGARGEHHYRSRLTENDVREIRRLASSGIYQKDIARRYSIRQGTVWAAISRKTWKHVE